MPSTSTQSLTLAIWQSVSRHLDINESTVSSAELLAELAPLQSLVVRRLDPDHKRVSVVGSWPATGADDAEKKFS